MRLDAAEVEAKLSEHKARSASSDGDSEDEDEDGWMSGDEDELELTTGYSKYPQFVLHPTTQSTLQDENIHRIYLATWLISVKLTQLNVSKL